MQVPLEHPLVTQNLPTAKTWHGSEPTAFQAFLKSRRHLADEEPEAQSGEATPEPILLASVRVKSRG